MYPWFNTDMGLGVAELLLTAPSESGTGDPWTSGWDGDDREDAETSAAALCNHSVV